MEHVMKLGVLLRDAIATEEVAELDAFDALLWGVCNLAHQTAVQHRTPGYSFENDLHDKTIDDAYHESLARGMQDE